MKTALDYDRWATPVKGIRVLEAQSIRPSITVRPVMECLIKCFC